MSGLVLTLVGYENNAIAGWRTLGKSPVSQGSIEGRRISVQFLSHKRHPERDWSRALAASHCSDSLSSLELRAITSYDITALV